MKKLFKSTIITLVMLIGLAACSSPTRPTQTVSYALNNTPPLITCVSKLDGRSFTFYKGNDQIKTSTFMPGLKINYIIDTTGKHHIINELEFKNYNCTAVNK